MTRTPHSVPPAVVPQTYWDRVLDEPVSGGGIAPTGALSRTVHPEWGAAVANVRATVGARGRQGERVEVVVPLYVRAGQREFPQSRRVHTRALKLARSALGATAEQVWSWGPVVEL